MHLIPILNGYCTCGENIGRFQKLYQILGTREDVFETLGLTKICCRMSFLNPPKYFLTCADIGRIHDDIGLLPDLETVQYRSYSISYEI